MRIARSGSRLAPPYLPRRSKNPNFLNRQRRPPGPQPSPDRTLGRLNHARGIPIRGVGFQPVVCQPTVFVLDCGSVDRDPLCPVRPGPISPRFPVRAGRKNDIAIHLEPADQPAGGPMYIGKVRMTRRVDLNRDPIIPGTQGIADRPFINRHGRRPGPFRSPADKATVDPHPIAAIGAKVEHCRHWRGGQMKIRTKIHISIAQIERMRRTDPDRAVRNLQCKVPYCSASLFTSR